MKPSASAQCASSARVPSFSAVATSARTRARSQSMATARAAPRDRASNESAPLPANGSSVVRPVRSWPSQLNSVSRTRSGVGRSAGRSGNPSLRPRHWPPMMRIALAAMDGTSQQAGTVELYRSQALPMLDLFKRKPDADSRPWSERLRASLSASRERLTRPLAALVGRSALGEADLEALESALLMADVGVPATERLLADLRLRWKRAEAGADPRELLKASLTALLLPLEQPLVVGPQRPFVIMLAGVNGAGKTTSIGKLAKWLQGQGLSVLLAAGDTFRAAAREQLEVWGQRNDVQVVAQQGGDPAAVMFDAIAAARARGIDVVLADTAGRLPTQGHLMEELKKIRRVLAKAQSGAPHETLLVIDAHTGQNTLAQVEAFDAALTLTGLIVTKLDGTAKGGVVAAIAETKAVPLRFIGVGEGLEDLRPFRASEFAEALLG